MGLFEKVFGTHSEKELKKIKPLIDKIEALDSDMQALSDYQKDEYHCSVVKKHMHAVVEKSVAIDYDI